MKLLEEKILSEGQVLPKDVLKIDSFLNHQVDSTLMNEIGKEFCRLFSNEKITKVLTIEASGISMAILTAYRLNVPMLFAKKSHTSNQSTTVYQSQVMSYTHGKVYDISVSKAYLSANDRVLIVDDFLATGNALVGLIDLVKQAGATLVGCGIAVEKVYQGGGNKLRAQGIRVESLARVASMTDTSLTFEE